MVEPLSTDQCNCPHRYGRPWHSKVCRLYTPPAKPEAQATEQKTPFAEAWEAFRQDVANIGIFDARTITKHGPYLEHRLHTAFSAGWNAGTAACADLARSTS